MGLLENHYKYGLSSSLFDEEWHREIKDPALQDECERLYKVYLSYKSIQQKLRIAQVVTLAVVLLLGLIYGKLKIAA